MATRNSRIFGLGLALATMLTLGVTLRAPGGLVAVGNDEASGVQGGAATCDTSLLISGNGCGPTCPLHTSYIDDGDGNTPNSTFNCSTSTDTCGNYINNSCQ